MEIYVDSANLDEIKKAKQLGLADGVTTNPTLIAREGNNPTKILEAICKEISGPVHAEVMAMDFEGIVKEAKEIVKIRKNIVVKIPMMHEGLRAVNTLKDLGIKTNLTLMFSASQAILAAKAGATYICPFLGRLDDISHDGVELLNVIKGIFINNPDIETKIVAASIRTPNHVVDLASIGIDILTIPGKILDQMEKHPLTDIGIEKFVEDAKNFQ